MTSVTYRCKQRVKSTQNNIAQIIPLCVFVILHVKFPQILLQLDPESQSVTTRGIFEREAQMVFDYSTLDSGLKVKT